MIPFYVFYSMFGLQRTGDQAWAFGDARGRGFMMGATAGRTTLTGEGLQHDDGQSHLYALAIPNLQSYDPAFAYELGVIVRDGIRRMWQNGEDVFYYITLYNENWTQPPMPEGVAEGHPPRAVPIPAGRGRRTPGPAPGLGIHPPPGPPRRGHPGRAVRSGGRRVERDLLPAAACRRAAGRPS